jgi:hypothetical protein
MAAKRIEKDQDLHVQPPLWYCVYIPEDLYFTGKNAVFEKK